MAKFNPSTIAATYGAISALNANFDTIADRLDKCLFRDGTSPNEMEAAIDMNHYPIRNLGAPINPTDAMRLEDIVEISGDSALASILALASGSSNVGFSQSGTGAITRTIQEKLRDRVSVLDFIPKSLHADITAGTSTADVTTYLQAALTAHLDVQIPSGKFILTDHLTLRTGQSIIMSPGTLLEQTGVGKNLFYAFNVSNISIDLNGGAIKGNGGWLNTWVSNGAAAGYRGLRFYNSNFVNVRGPGRIYNWGHAGISFEGGTSIRVDDLTIEGTHEYGTPIDPLGNFQMGVYIKHALATGPADRVILSNLDISGTAQGVLVEFESGSQPGEGIQIINPMIHDIPGQHAFYLQCGQITVTNPMLRNIHLTGVKLQATADQNEPLSNLVVTGMNAKDLGSHMFEIAHIGGTGSIQNCHLQGVGENTNTGIGITAASTGSVRNIRVELNLKNTTTSAVVFTGAGLQQDIDITVTAEDIQQHGIVSTATNQNNIVIRPIIRNSNLSNTAGQSAIIAGASGSKLIVVDPVVSGVNHRYAIATSAAGAQITIRGTPELTTGVTGLIQQIGVVEGTMMVPYTPTLTSTGGDLVGTRHLAEYRVDGKMVTGKVHYTVTSGTGELDCPLPYPAKHAGGLVTVFEQASAGVIKNGIIREGNLSVVNVTDLQVSGANLVRAATVAPPRKFYITFQYERA